jgi:hypothetical protein
MLERFNNGYQLLEVLFRNERVTTMRTGDHNYIEMTPPNLITVHLETGTRFTPESNPRVFPTTNRVLRVIKALVWGMKDNVMEHARVPTRERTNESGLLTMVLPVKAMKLNSNKVAPTLTFMLIVLILAVLKLIHETTITKPTPAPNNIRFSLPLSNPNVRYDSSTTLTLAFLTLRG